MSTSLEHANSDQTVVSSDEVSETIERLCEFPWSSVPVLAARLWLLWTAGIAAAVGLLRRNRLVIASLVWMTVFYLFGSSYVLGTPILTFANLGAVFTLYVPLGLIIGSAAEEGLLSCGSRWHGCATEIAMALTLAAGFVASRIRVTHLEPYRYFVGPVGVQAMAWIRENTPGDALSPSTPTSGFRKVHTGKMPGTGCPTSRAARPLQVPC